MSYKVLKAVTLKAVEDLNPGDCSEFNEEFSGAVSQYVDDYGFYGEIPVEELEDGATSRWIDFLIENGFIEESTNTVLGTYFQRKKTGAKYVLAYSEKFNLLQLVAVCSQNAGRIWNSLNAPNLDKDAGVDEETMTKIFGKGKFKEIAPVC